MEHFIKVLILDDDAHFRSSTCQLLELIGNFQAEAPEEFTDTAILDKLNTFHPDIVVMDVWIGDPSCNCGGTHVKETLDRLSQNGANWDAYRILLITGWESFDMRDLSSLQQIYPSIYDTFLTKPVRIEEFSSTLHTVYNTKNEAAFDTSNEDDLTPETPTGWLSVLKDLPVPIRVYNQDSSIAFVNDAWDLPRNRPILGELSSIKTGKTDIREHWQIQSVKNSPSDTCEPPKKEPAPFRLISTRAKNLGNRILQVAQPLDERRSQGDLKRSVEFVFSAMERANFFKGRYYDLTEITEGQYIRSLQKVHGSDKDEIVGTARPNSNYMNRLLKQLIPKIDIGKNEIISKVISREEYKNDADETFWDDKLGITSEKLLIIPVLRTKREPFSLPEDKKLKPVGIFYFDHQTAGENILADSVFLEMEKALQPIRLSLRAAICDLVHTMKFQENREDVAFYELLTLYDEKFSKARSYSSMLTLLLQAAIELLSQRKQDKKSISGGILATVETNGGDKQFHIVAAEGGAQESLRGAKQSIAEIERLSSVTCWNKKSPEITSKLSKDKRVEWGNYVQKLKLSKAKKDRLATWVKKELNSVAAYPIESGSETVGVIVLHGTTESVFTSEETRRMKILLKRAQWFLHSHAMNRAKLMWERSLVHEFGSGLSIVKNFFDADKDPIVSTEQKTILQKRSKAQLINMLNLCADFSDSHKRPTFDTTVSFNDAGDPLRQFKHFYSDYLDQLTITLDLNLPEQLNSEKLVGDKKVYARVVRTLLGNAMKFSNPAGCIEVSLFMTEKKNCMRLEISNEWQMTEEEDRLKFKMMQKPKVPRKDGSHFGLAVAKTLTEGFGGHIQVNNSQRKNGPKIVEAILDWPLCPKGEK